MQQNIGDTPNYTVLKYIEFQGEIGTCIIVPEDFNILSQKLTNLE